MALPELLILLEALILLRSGLPAMFSPREIVQIAMAAANNGVMGPDADLCIGNAREELSIDSHINMILGHKAFRCPLTIPQHHPQHLPYPHW